MPNQTGPETTKVIREIVAVAVLGNRVEKLEKALEGVLAPFAAMTQSLPEAQQQDAKMRIAAAKDALSA